MRKQLTGQKTRPSDTQAGTKFHSREKYTPAWLGGLGRDILILCSVWLFASASYSLAEGDLEARTYGAWHSSDIGGGGFLQHVVFCPSKPKRIYLTSDVGGLFRSDDNGQTWHMLHGSMSADAGSYSVRGLLVSPTNADRIVVAFGAGTWSKHGIFVSDDAGATWQQTLDAAVDGNGPHRGDGYVLAASPADPKTLYFAADMTGLYRSNDGGQSWSHLGPDQVAPRDLVIDRTNPQRIWLNSAKTNEGKWNAPSALFLSEDGGGKWDSICAEPPREMIQDPVDATILYALAGSKQVVRSKDQGRTWESYSTGLPPYVANDDARGKGAVGGLAVARGAVIIGTRNADFYRLDTKTNAWGKIVCEGIDEGNWWGRIRPGTYQHCGSAMSFIGVDPHDPDHGAFTDWYAIYQTFDAGKHWKLTIDGIEMLVMHTVTQDPGHPKVVLAGAADIGYFRSTNDGDSFESDHNGISNNIKCISVCKAQPKRVYATGPQRWEWWANQVYVSDDDGLSWHAAKTKGLPDMEKARSNTVAVNPSAPDEVYLTVSGEIGLGGGGVYRSADAGQSWTWLGDGLPTGQRFFRTDIWTSGPEIAVSADGSMVAISIDHNKTVAWDRQQSKWREIALPGVSVHAVMADLSARGRFYLAGQQGGLLRSDDGGGTWTRVTTGDISEVAVDCQDSKRLAAVTSTNVLFSQDGGAKWLSIGKNLPYRQGRNIVAFADERIVVGTGGSGVFWIAINDAVNASVPFPQSTQPPVKVAGHGQP